MCTASWISSTDGYTLFFNRDEQRSRAAGRPAQVMIVAGVRILAPQDAEAGGTWIGVNEHGVTVCLLNGPSDGPPWPLRPTSRGLLVASLLDSRSTAEVRDRIDSLSLAPYRAFTLVAIEPGHPAMLLDWDGVAVSCRRVAQSGLLATSSSVDAVAVRLNRHGLFNELVHPDSAALQALHRSHRPSASARSICMHRGDAETVSACRIDVTAGSAALAYTPDSPCRVAAPVTLCLSRVHAGVSV